MVLGSWAPGSEGGGSGYPHSLCWCGQPLPPFTLHTSHSPTSEPGQPDTPGMQSESWAGPGLSCEERTFQEAASGTQSPERGPAGTRLSRPAPPRPRSTSGGGMGGGDIMSSICLTCPSFLPPHLLPIPPELSPAPGRGPLEVGGASIPGYPGLSKILEWVAFYGGGLCPSPIRLCNRLCSSHRWLPPPSPEMSGRRLPVSYTGAPQSLGAPSPRVKRWRCC